MHIGQPGRGPGRAWAPGTFRLLQTLLGQGARPAVLGQRQRTGAAWGVQWSELVALTSPAGLAERAECPSLPPEPCPSPAFQGGPAGQLTSAGGGDPCPPTAPSCPAVPPGFCSVYLKESTGLRVCLAGRLAMNTYRPLTSQEYLFFFTTQRWVIFLEAQQRGNKVIG